MTLEELTSYSADKLEKMTDAELLEHFKPFLDVTRPERASVRRVITQNNNSKQPAITMTPEKQKAFELLANQGVDIAELLRRKKKK